MFHNFGRLVAHAVFEIINLEQAKPISEILLSSRRHHGSCLVLSSLRVQEQSQGTPMTVAENASEAQLFWQLLHW